MNYDNGYAMIASIIMARVARNTQQSTIYSITHQAQQPLFRNDADREVFIEILKSAHLKFGFICYAYCLLNDFRFHLVLDVNKSSISRIMQSITVAYTAYYKPDHKLFTQRFKSKALTSQQEVLDEINRIHQSTDSKFNSFCMYQPTMDNNIEWLTPLTLSTTLVIDQPNQPATQQQIQAYILNWLKQNQCDQHQIKSNKQLRNQCIASLYKQTNVSLKQIGQLFGGLSESTISKILKQTLQDS